MYNITSTWTELLQQFFPIFTVLGAISHKASLEIECLSQEIGSQQHLNIL